jgi:hypothetical protein
MSWQVIFFLADIDIFNSRESAASADSELLDMARRSII